MDEVEIEDDFDVEEEPKKEYTPPKEVLPKVMRDNILNEEKKLEEVAGSLKLCDNTELRKLGYRRINFMYHRYFMLYRVDGDMAIVDNIFHELQDYENKMM